MKWLIEGDPHYCPTVWESEVLRPAYLERLRKLKERSLGAAPARHRPPSDDGQTGVQLTGEAKAILFIQERLKTTGRLPTKKAVADLLEVSDRTMRNWRGFNVAYAELERKHGSVRRRPRGEKSKDGTLEAWQD